MEQSLAFEKNLMLGDKETVQQAAAPLLPLNSQTDMVAASATRRCASVNMVSSSRHG